MEGYENLTCKEADLIFDRGKEKKSIETSRKYGCLLDQICEAEIDESYQLYAREYGC